jgi:hypothetical protein
MEATEIIDDLMSGRLAPQPPSADPETGATVAIHSPGAAVRKTRYAWNRMEYI